MRALALLFVLTTSCIASSEPAPVEDAGGDAPAESATKEIVWQASEYRSNWCDSNPDAPSCLDAGAHE